MKLTNIIKCWLIALLSLLCTVPAYASLNSIVAVVNQHVITQAQLQKQLAITRDRLKHVSAKKRPPKLVLKRQTLNRLINRQLQLQKAQELGINVSSQELAKALAQMAHHKDMSVHELYKQARQDGYSKKEFQKEVHDEILGQKVQGAILGRQITITPQEVNDYIDSHQKQLRHMVQYYVKDYWLAIPENAGKQTVKSKRKQAQKVHELLTNNQSDQLPDKVTINDMGWKKLGELPTPFVPKLVNMQTNHYAQPIKTSNGFHILYLKGKKTPNHEDVQKEVHARARHALFQQKMRQAMINWLAKLRSQAYIQVMPQSLKPILNNS